MKIDLLDESIMALISEAETSAFHLLDLKDRAKGSISNKGGYLYRQWREGNKWKYERIEGNFKTQVARLNDLKNQYRRERERIRKLNKILIKAGFFAVSSLPEQILSLLSSKRVISEHGILVGSFAFFAYQTALGFSLGKSLTRTSDIDLVRPPEMQLAVRQINLANILDRLKIPYKPDGPGGRAVRYVFQDGFKVEVLYPHIKGRPKGIVSPQHSGFADIGAQELRFLNPLTVDPIQTVLVGKKGPIPVIVPDPARFLLHKLAVSSLRKQPSKMVKDIAQAEIIAHAMNERAMLPDVKEAMTNFRGRKIEKYLASGIERLKARNQKLGQILRDYFQQV